MTSKPLPWPDHRYKVPIFTPEWREMTSAYPRPRTIAVRADHTYRGSERPSAEETPL